jgi:hypothetical protein
VDLLAGRRGDSSHELTGGKLDAGHLAVMTHPGLGETQAPQSLLGRLDLSELSLGNLLIVRNTGRQAGRGGLVGAWELQRPGHGTHGGFTQPCIGQGPEDLMVTGRARPGPIRAHHVIGILAIGHGRQAMSTGYFIFYPGKQLVFAMKAAIRAIGPVGRVINFPRLNLDDAGADDRGDPMCRKTFIRPQTGRDGEDGNHLVGAECPDGQREQDRGIDTTGERDAQRAAPRSREPTAWAAAESSPVRG